MTESPFEPSRVRRAVDALLARYPYFDLLYVDWQRKGVEVASLARLGDLPSFRFYPDDLTLPWVRVWLGEPAVRGDAWAIWPFAIWKTTGDVYRVGADGAVGDEPLIRGEEG